MKITIIGHDRVYPPVSADAQRFYHLSEHLSNDFNVLLIGHSGMIKRFKKYKINENFYIMEITGRTQMGIGALGYFLTKKPLFDLVLAMSCEMFPKTVKTYFRHANESDILVFEGCWYYPLLKHVKNRDKKLVVYDARNVEYLLKRQAYTGVYRKLLPKLFELENGLCSESDVILATCEAEKEKFTKLYSLNKNKITVTQPGMILPKEGRYPEKRTVLFIGGAYFANFEAARFINEKLAKALPDFVFRVVGRAGMGIKNRQKNVKIYGMVSEKEKDKLLRSSEIAINPILHGAGMNVKMLEYMAYGLPVVTTGLGARGFDERPFVVSDLENFDESIKKLSENHELKQEISEIARDVIKKKYEWSAVTKGISKLFMKGLRKKRL